MRKITLLANLNCGKTTLFNLLTGSNQKVGNWPGVTIDKKRANFKRILPRSLLIYQAFFTFLYKRNFITRLSIR
ncbi:FeoB small GTPase domain-containing protein [Facklamia sp. P12955]|uniref:FeoB small GTPase domain-containing protein n=1 Tax=Facklamia sp. P12955 TaxID=3421946 RepID=UPI003D17CE2C